MSDQTPNSSDELARVEPSMEDILASIRKIISDDEPVAMESPEDIASVELADSSVGEGFMRNIQADVQNSLPSAALDVPAVEAVKSFAAEGETVDLNIDDVLAELDLDENVLGREPEAAYEAATINDLVQAEASATDNLMDDPLADLMEDLDLGDEDVNVLDTKALDLSAEADVSSLDDLVGEVDAPVNDDVDDILAFLDEDIPATEAAPAALEAFDVGETATADLISNTEELADFTPGGDAASDLEMDALLDDILLTPMETQAVELPVELEDISSDELSLDDILYDDLPVEAALIDDVPVEEELSDLDLVKSLMADLADDPSALDADEDLDALLSIPDIEAEANAAVQDAGAVDMEEDILGDILDMSLNDELDSHPDEIDVSDIVQDDLTSLADVLEAEQDNIVENAISFDDASGDLPSLSDIAAAAEADAMAVEAAQVPQTAALATAGLTAAFGGAALGVTHLADKAEPDAGEEAAFDEIDALIGGDETAIEAVETHLNETLDVDDVTAAAEISYTEIEHLSDPITTQETSMPVKAVQTDAILDDVTEAATAGAFAELNQVVEDKAVFNERGPRIGDLVQDALRPMIKEWLDANLKGIVERAVTKEVKRISQGK